MSWAAEEVVRVKAALARHNDKLDEKRRYWRENNGICCPACMFGQPYTDLCDKIERVEAWLKILETKAKRAENGRPAET